MPRNDQVTRQWLLLQKLESARGATLQELAASLPADFSRHLRTCLTFWQMLVDSSEMPKGVEQSIRISSAAISSHPEQIPSPKGCGPLDLRVFHRLISGFFTEGTLTTTGEIL